MQVTLPGGLHFEALHRQSPNTSVFGDAMLSQYLYHLLIRHCDCINILLKTRSHMFAFPSYSLIERS
jgi:hypothetical protein